MMNACEYCEEINGNDVLCENCHFGNPCLGCNDYQNGECVSNGGCAKEIEE